MTAPLFYLESVPAAGTVIIEGSQARHAVSSMRLQPGEEILVGDGAGLLATCTVTDVQRRGSLRADIVSSDIRTPPTPLTVVQAIPKGDRGDLAVELLTECGATRIVPWASQRTVANWRGKETAKLERWRRVARAAAMQSRRAHMPQVDPPEFGVPRIDPHTVVLHEQAAVSLFDVPPPSGPVTVVVGPEGGLAPSEVESLVAGGALVVNLGSLILRTSTAGAAACVWLRGLEQHTKT